MRNFAIFAVVGTCLAMPVSVSAHEAGDLIVRVGVAHVEPSSETSDPIVVAAPPLPDSRVSSLSSDTQPGVTFTYMVADHIGIEAILALPFTVNAELEGGVPLATGSPEIGSSKYLPEIVSVQYFPLKPESKFQPYVGVGLNYTLFFDGEASDALNASAAGPSTVNVDDSIGIALQVGADIEVADGWLLNASAWYVDADTDVTVSTTNIGDIPINNVKINPFIFAVTVGKKF